MNLLGFMGIGGQELLLIMLVVLILFGAKKIPEFARGLGQGIREFRKASREIQEEIERAAQEPTSPTVPNYSSTPGTAEEDHLRYGVSPDAGAEASGEPPLEQESIGQTGGTQKDGQASGV